MTTLRTLLLSAVALAASFTAIGVARAFEPAVEPRTALTLTPVATAADRAALQAIGAHEVDRPLRLWVADSARARPVVALLRARGALGLSAPVRTYDIADPQPTADPLIQTSWWRAAINAAGLEPPGPGAPVTVVDSGVDFAHPELAGRADLVALNPQEPSPVGGEHGTMVTSVIGAPRNGVGTVGVYPRAVVRSWDTALGGGQSLDSLEIARGIVTAARSGRGVINLSLGGSRDETIELAIEEAVARGSLVVAASGNDGRAGSPLSYPAATPHVLTVAATDRADQVAPFSSRSPHVDLAAPGDGIVVASALSGAWQEASGTSFAAPIVSAAAAWLWTVRPELDASQVAEILRRSARDIALPGRDTASGFGILDVAAALGASVPQSDPFEPNDALANVVPNGQRNLAHAPSLTTPTRPRATIVGREDRYEDPTDIYRVWVPAARRLTVALRSTGDNDMLLATAGTTPRLLTARATARGRSERLSYANSGAGRYAYVAVTLAPGTTAATYTLTAQLG